MELKQQRKDILINQQKSLTLPEAAMLVGATNNP